MSKEQMRPSSKEQAPDPSVSYERDHPEQESATGQLTPTNPPPAETADAMHQAVPNQTKASRQINAQDSQSEKAAAANTPKAKQ